MCFLDLFAGATASRCRCRRVATAAIDSLLRYHLHHTYGKPHRANTGTHCLIFSFGTGPFHNIKLYDRLCVPKRELVICRMPPRARFFHLTTALVASVHLLAREKWWVTAAYTVIDWKWSIVFRFWIGVLIHSIQLSKNEDLYLA